MPFIAYIVGLFGFTALQATDAGSLTWDVPPSCPDRVALMQAIERRLGHSLTAGEVEVVGTISQHAVAPRYRLQLELTTSGRSQTHTLSAERCAPLVDGAAILVVAMAAPELPAAEPDTPQVPEPVTLASSQQVDPITEPAPPNLDEPVRSAVVVTKPDPPRPRARSGPGVLIRVFGGPEFGAVPGVSGAVGLAAGPLWRRARLELQGVYIAHRQMEGDNSVSPSLFTGAAVGCGRLGRRQLEVPLCGGLELGGVRWTAEGPGALSGPGTDIWLAATATAAVAWHAGRRLTLMLALHGLVHLAAPRFKVGSETLFVARPVSGRLLLGLELRFGDPW
jgi:hypothetical protein